MGDSRRAANTTAEHDTTAGRSRPLLPLILGGIGLLLVGGVIGAAVTGGLVGDSESTVAPPSSGQEIASLEASVTGGVPLAPKGSELATVTSPPARTLTYVTMEKGASVTYDVTFAPYGLAPSGLGDNRIVIHILTAQRHGDGVTIDLAGMNAVVGMKAESGGADVVTGGTYQGVIEVRQEADGRGALFLTEVRPGS